MWSSFSSWTISRLNLLFVSSSGSFPVLYMHNTSQSAYESTGIIGLFSSAVNHCKPSVQPESVFVWSLKNLRSLTRRDTHSQTGAPIDQTLLSNYHHVCIIQRGYLASTPALPLQTGNSSSHFYPWTSNYRPGRLAAFTFKAVSAAFVGSGLTTIAFDSKKIDIMSQRVWKKEGMNAARGWCFIISGVC